MFVGRRRVCQLEMCDRNVFGNMVIVRQNPPVSPLPSTFTDPIPMPSPLTQSRRRTTSDELQFSSREKEQNERRRTSQLLDELLLDIYNRDNCSSLSGYTSTTSLRSQKSFNKYFVCDLQLHDSQEILALIEHFKSDVARTGSALVRKLKRRDALRRQRDARCDVITNYLRKRAPENSNMRFSIEPAPGDSGFSQWHSAMRMVAQLPGGIPPEFRRKLWLNLADKHLSSKNVNWEKVERECFSEWSHPADAELGVQIVKDLHRTGCSLFCGEDGQENQALLKRVLLAYARWNKAVGYCQGFNMLAALILQVTDKCESEALKLMIFLIEGVLPVSYFADSLRGLSVDMAVFRELLKARLPRLSKHLDALQTAAKDGTTSYEPPLTNVFTMQWFLTLFCNCLPQPTLFRVWDLILLEGNEILLRTALAIWQALSDKIMSVRSADEFYCIMGVLTREILEFGIVDANSLIKAIVTIGPLTELPALREKYLYNINPWGSNVSSSVEAEVRNRQIKLYGRERLALDIGALKKQYSKLKQRQRQAHIIFSAAVARQPANSPVVAMNHLLLGKRPIIPAKRLGPPKGSIPPARLPPTTLHWKDAPPRQSSSSSSSDTELCDDPEDQEDLPLSKANSPSSCQFQDDNLLKTNSDNLDLMNLDNTEEHSELSSESGVSNLISESELNLDTGQLIGEMAEDNNQIGDIFDTSASTKQAGDLFDFGRYGLHSDSDDDGFDFEKFLETRVRGLKQTSLDEDSVGSSSEESTEQKKTGTRKNSQRALEIIQENSLILHRILQCQSRLTPSPTILDTESVQSNSPDRPTRQLSQDMILEEINVKSPDSSLTPPLCYSSFEINNANPLTESINYSENNLVEKYKRTCDDRILPTKDVLELSRESSPQFDIPGSSLIANELSPYKYTEDVYQTPNEGDSDFRFESTALEEESLFENQNIYETEADALSENNRFTFHSKLVEEKNEIFDLEKTNNDDKNLSDDEETRPSFTSILDSEYARNLEEKYENLILKSSRPTFLEVAASFDKKDGSGESEKSSSPVDAEKLNFDIKSPNSDSSIKKSPNESSNFVRSPTTGRIYNPFPVNISSRQNKEVALRLGIFRTLIVQVDGSPLEEH